MRNSIVKTMARILKPSEFLLLTSGNVGSGSSSGVVDFFFPQAPAPSRFFDEKGAWGTLQ